MNTITEAISPKHNRIGLMAILAIALIGMGAINFFREPPVPKARMPYPPYVVSYDGLGRPRAVYQCDEYYNGELKVECGVASMPAHYGVDYSCEYDDLGRSTCADSHAHTVTETR